MRMELALYWIDVAMTGWINALSGHFRIVDMMLVWVSAIGLPLLVAAVALQWWSPPDRSNIRHILLSAGLAFLLGLLLNQILLLGIHRIRPYDAGVSRLLVSPSADPSFPSDHATASFAIAAIFLLHGLRRGYGFLAAAILVSLSRVYLGTHYVSDVLGGGATGIVAALAVFRFYPKGSRIDRFLTNIL